MVFDNVRSLVVRHNVLGNNSLVPKVYSVPKNVIHVAMYTTTHPL